MVIGLLETQYGTKFLMENYFIIQDLEELELLDNKFPNLENVCLVLLSNNFSLFDKHFFKGRKYFFFDDKITFEDSKVLANAIDYYVWNWFLDKDGKDLSLIEGCSIGSALAGSIHILLNTQFRYELGFKKLLKNNSKLFFTSNCEKIFKIIIPKITADLNVETIELQSVIKPKVLSYGRLKVNVTDPLGRHRDLKSIFKSNKIKDFILNLFLNKFVDENKKKVLLVQSGKLENFFDDIQTNNNFLKNHILYRSPRGMFDILLNNRKGKNFYYFSANEEIDKKKIKDVTSNLKKNLISRFKQFDYIISTEIMDKFIFPCFSDAFSFFKDVEKKLSKINPDLVVLSADDHEYHILAAQAAMKVNIKTAEIPHGMYNGGYKNYKTGRFKVFDYFLCFGDAGRSILLSLGVLDKNIKISSFPYFEKFIPVKKLKPKSYKQCLILAPDYMNISPSEKIRDYVCYLVKTIDLLNKHNIQIKGIKFRHQFIANQYKYLLKKQLNKFTFYSGYKNLPELLDDVDLVIGPVSTALIETNLMGKDYFAYETKKFHHSTPFFYKKMYNIINVSSNINTLEKNILLKKTFKKDFNVENLICLNRFGSKTDLYNYFIKVLYSNT